ncbi:MAG: HDIG domain-containing protein [Planctomycetaceae bacterium]|nr:HDIG domain-containing protein [Planctomycetaceae bacterium]
MKLFGTQKRSRVTRKVTHRGGSTSVRQFFSLKYQRGRLLQFSTGLLATIAIVVVLSGWVYPFPYRNGDRFPDGLAARSTFEVINNFETSRLAKERERMVPLIFRNDPETLRNSPERLKAALGAIAESESLEHLSLEIREAFGLSGQVNLTTIQPTDSGNGSALTANDDAQFRYQQLREAITPLDARQSETHISSIIDEYSRFIQPLLKTGLINPKDLARRDLGLDSPLAIVNSQVNLPKPNPLEDTEIWMAASITDVSLSDLLNDAGFLGQRWSDFPRLDIIRAPLTNWMRNQVRPTLEYDQASTQRARRFAGERVEPVYDLINEGDEFLPPDGVIDQNLLNTLWAQYKASLDHFTWDARLARSAIVFLMVSVLMIFVTWYLVRFEPGVILSWPRFTVFLTVIVVAALFGRLASFDPVRGEVAVVAATAMIVAIAFNQRMAIVTSLFLSLLIVMSTRMNMVQFTAIMAAAVTSIICLKRVQSRSTIIKAGFLAGLATFVVSWGMEVLVYPSGGLLFWFDQTLLQLCLKNAGWCVLAGFILAGSLPFIESTFGVVTGISLLEMSDPSHPLLQELVRRAPGTYNHSIALATIAEAAAKVIGADGLLVRVGAYFHDVGKIPKAEYFIENRPAGAANRHDTLAPAMSTLIIIGHVKDGVELAEEYHLPQALIDFIEQHHGTTLVEYFYHAASKKADADPDHRQDVEEAAFRYPGPKPQSREAGILMLADCVESASRTLSEPTPARIRTLVHQLTMKRLLDGQFDECSLKLSEIKQIEESLIKSLISMHHGRIVYPEAQKEQKSA